MADSYNKYVKTGAGTLVENWFEERLLREHTGWGRHYPIEHVPKTKDGPAYTRSRVDTDLRVLGPGLAQPFLSFNREYGRTPDPTSGMRKTGLRKLVFLDTARREVTAALLAQEQAQESLRLQRHLQTTAQATFNWKVPSHCVGKRLMKTQDGLAAAPPDEVFRVEHGLGKPQARRPRAELEAEVAATAFPVTLQTSLSPVKTRNPFARPHGLSMQFR